MGTAAAPPSRAGAEAAAASLPGALSSFVDTLTQTSTMEELESSYFDGVRAFLPYRAAGLYLFDPFASNVERISAAGVSDYFLSRYEAVGRARDPVLHHALRHQQPAHVAALMSTDEWRTSDLYREVFSLHKMTVLAEGAIVAGGKVIGTLNFGDDGRPLDDRDLQLLGALGGLMGLVIGSIREREQLGRERDRAAAVLDLCNEAIVVTDVRTGQRRVNAAAARLLEHLSESDADACIDDLLASQQRDSDAVTARAPLVLPDGTEAEIRMDCVRTETDPGVIVSFLYLRDRRAERLPAHIGALLTKREREVAELVLQGLHDADVAGAMFISPYTVKQYLKSVYRKLGVGSRFDLARAILDGRNGADPAQGPSARPA